MQRRMNDSVSPFIGPVLAFVSFVLVTIFDPFNVGARYAGAIPAFLLSIVILVVNNTFVLRGQADRVDVAVEKIEARSSEHNVVIEQAVRKHLHIQRLGNAEKAYEYLLTRLPSLTNVRNTSFTLEAEAELVDDMLYRTRTFLDGTDQIAARIKDGLNWRDVGDERGINRMRDLAERCDDDVGAFRYKYRVLDRDEPQINFIVLSYGESDQEVLFNWDYRSGGNDPVVMLSRDKDVTSMFATHFELLWRAATDDHDLKNATSSTSAT